MNKKIIATIILIILTLFISTASFAIPTTIDPDDYATEPSIDTSGEAMELAGRIVGLINIVGTIVLVATVMILGIKYMVGSVEEKADYKKTMIPVLIGAILLFCTTTLINVIYNIMSQM